MAKANTKNLAVAAVAAMAAVAAPVITGDAVNLQEIPVPENEGGAATGPAGEVVLDVQPDLVINGIHRVAGVPQKGFYRAGRHWPREGVEVARSDFTDDQWAALEAEPNVTIKPL